MSQLALRVAGSHVEGTWEVPLPDARTALGLDPRVAGPAGWRDVQQREAAFRAYVRGRLALAADGVDCATEIAAASVIWHSDTEQVAVALVSTCRSDPNHLGLRCDLLFDLEPNHRVYISVEDARSTHLGVITQAHRSATVDVRHFNPWAGFIEFVREGIWHIGTGFDHMLFLLALLLPAPLVRLAGGHWSPRIPLGSVMREAVKVVTAFTAAHSVTLGLSFFGLATLPPRWVESGIALSVFVAAWNNLRPFLPGRAWVVALVFGLVHGLGFAGVLRNLSLPNRSRGLALAAFNVGVEVGQLAIVALLLPALYAASKRRAYPRLVMGAGSLAIAWLAVLWFLERAFGLSLIGRG